MATSSVSVKVITWEGSITVEKAGDLKTELLDAISQASQVVVSVSMLDYVDLAVLQLLKAAAKEASLAGKVLHLTGTVKPELARVLEVSGFVRKAAENARDLEAELFAAPPSKES